MRPDDGIGSALLRVAGILTRRDAERVQGLYPPERPDPGEVLRLGERPLRVLALAMSGTSYQKYCARDIVQGLSAQGVEARACILDLSAGMDCELYREILAFDPDLLFCNGRGREGLPPLPEGLCVLSWDQDYALSPPGSPYARRRGPRDRLLVMLEDWREGALRSGVPESAVAHLNLGANPEIYHPLPSSPAPLEHDVLFVGNYYPWETYRRMIRFDALQPRVQRVLLEARSLLREWVLGRRGDEAFVIPDLGTLLKEGCERAGEQGGLDDHAWSALVRDFRYRVAHLLLRELFVESLAEFRLGLFGHGWNALPTAGKWARPPIVNGEPLREAIRRSALSLHLHTWTVHHPRLYDTAAAGGALLVGRVPEAHPLDRVFEPGAEVETFATIAEMKRKIRHLLAHPEERIAMGEEAARRAARDHGMPARMARCLGFLSGGKAHDRAVARVA